MSALGCLTSAADPCPTLGEGTRCVLCAGWVTSQTCRGAIVVMPDPVPPHRPGGNWCTAVSLSCTPQQRGILETEGHERFFFHLNVFLGGFFFPQGGMTPEMIHCCFPGGISEPLNKQQHPSSVHSCCSLFT